MFLLSSLGGLCGFYLSLVENLKVLVTIGSEHPLKERAYSPLSISFHIAPAMGDSLLPHRPSWTASVGNSVFPMLETLYFQWGESQQEEAIPFRRKSHLFPEGQSYMQPLARKNSSDRSVPCRVCESYDLVGSSGS